jgi:HSP20 family protein
MPGVKPEDVDIQVSGNQVSLRGEVRKEKGEEKANYLLREHRYQSFSRTLTLPTAVVADDAKAEIRDGVLHLTLPKADETRPKVITVKTK